MDDYMLPALRAGNMILLLAIQPFLPREIFYQLFSAANIFWALRRIKA